MQSLFNRAELYKNCVRETSAVCDEGERKGGKQIVFARKKRLLHRLIISYKLDETNFFISECFIRTHRTWITANASIYKISTWVDIFHFQFSISLYYQHPLEQKSGSYLPELPPIQPEVNREKQRRVATWFTLVALKTENLYLGMQKMNVRFVGQAINRIYAVLLVTLFTKSSLKMFSRLQYPYF